MDSHYLHAVLGILGGGGLAVAIVAYAARRMVVIVEKAIQRSVDVRFDNAKHLFELQMGIDAELARNARTTAATAYVSLSTLCYKAKLAAEEVDEARDIFGLSHPDLIDGCRELTTNLISYRIYLDEGVFECLHLYKHMLQDLLVACDTFSRRSPGPNPRTALDPTQKELLQLRVAGVIDAYDAVSARLQEAFKGPERRLGREEGVQTHGARQKTSLLGR